MQKLLSSRDLFDEIVYVDSKLRLASLKSPEFRSRDPDFLLAFAFTELSMFRMQRQKKFWCTYQVNERKFQVKVCQLGPLLKKCAM